MINFFNSFISLFPDAIEPFLRIGIYAFVILTVVNIVVTVIWAIRQVIKLFIPVG